MWDLHMHTNLSDGELTVEQLCTYLKKEKIKLFSITDHNHALAYKEKLPTDIAYITGAELATSYKGKIIEIHGYLNDPKVINQWYRNFYSSENLVRNEQILFERIQKVAQKEGLNYTENLQMPEIKKGISKKTMYQDLVENNPALIKTFPTYKTFFRQGLSDPESKFFINEGSTYPTRQEVIDLIHQAGGKAVLAHPYEYQFPDTMKELNLLRQELDGIESFHPSASYRQSLAVVDFCNDNHLITSGGSDFHRFAKRVRVGVRVYEDLYEALPFQWLHEFISKEEFV